MVSVEIKIFTAAFSPYCLHGTFPPKYSINKLKTSIKKKKKKKGYILPTSHLFHLSLRHAATIIDDACGLKACGLIELNEQLPHHVGQVLDHLLAEELLLKKE